MSPVQETDFSGPVGCLILDKNHIQTGFPEGQFFFHTVRRFDHEEVERLAAVQQVVLVAQFFADGIRRCPGITGNDPVHQCAAEGVGVFDVVDIIRTERPFRGILDHVLFEGDPVLVNEFAGEEDQPREAGFEPFVKERGHFGGEGGLGDARGVGFRLVFDPGFRGVGEAETQVGAAEGFHGFLPFRVSIQTALDRFDHAGIFHQFAVCDPTEDQGVKTVLRIDHVRKPFFQRLNDLDRSVEPDFPVHFIDHPINKRAEEVTFTELNDFHRHVAGRLTLEQIHKNPILS